MTVEEIGIYTIADLERERDRDDALRWELLAGELVMTPAPRPLHQQMAFRVAQLLDAAIPPQWMVLMAPVDLRLSDRSVLQPDVVVLPHSQVLETRLEGVPVLAIEVLSPSTRRRDLVTKLEILRAAGCPHYWVLDPDATTFRAWQLVDDDYVLQAEAVGSEEVRITEPVQLSLSVADLARRR